MDTEKPGFCVGTQRHAGLCLLWVERLQPIIDLKAQIADRDATDQILVSVATPRASLIGTFHTPLWTSRCVPGSRATMSAFDPLRTFAFDRQCYRGEAEGNFRAAQSSAGNTCLESPQVFSSGRLARAKRVSTSAME